jgi:hypothetical protein
MRKNTEESIAFSFYFIIIATHIKNAVLYYFFLRPDPLRADSTLPLTKVVRAQKLK